MFFPPEIPEQLTFFSRVLASEIRLLDFYAGVSAAVGLGQPTTPARMVTQNLPASRIALGPLKSSTGSAHRSAQIGVTVLTSWHFWRQERRRTSYRKPYPSRDSRVYQATFQKTELEYPGVHGLHATPTFIAR